ncbi:tyrosine-type recombinase/integrase [Massilia alkalitolerans]|uniref:tyrosine-type recombinase/integrase n=1 Tax=Massilia alkalitolerans TaxID=286638 RepID=UPI0004089BF5|nr:site-specific integrase [Massilia alkalitolerans]
MRDGELVLLEPSSSAVALAPGVTIDDLKAIVAWVASKRNSEHTRRAFGFEARRWLAWLMWCKAGQPFTRWLDKASSLDAAAYAQFLAGPKDHAIPQAVLKRAGLERPPFRATPLASASVDRAISALKAMYADLIEMTLEDGYTIERNPFNRFKVSSVMSKASPRKKALTAKERGYVDEALDELKREGQILEYHQQKWVWTALLWAALRRHELAAAVAGDVHQDNDEDGEPTWMIEIVGKGGTVNTVPLADQFMDGMREYRLARGLPALPTGDKDRTPLVLPVRGPMRNVHPETINRAIKKLLTRAAQIAEASDNPAAVSRLNSFASHCARHTQVTMIVDATGDITLGQEIARHGSITTTRRYKAKSVSRLKQALVDVGSK